MNDPSRSFLERHRALIRFMNDLGKEEDKVVWMAADAAKHAHQVHKSLTGLLEQHQVQSEGDGWAEWPQQTAKIEMLTKEFMNKLDYAGKIISKEFRTQKKIEEPAGWFLDITKEVWLTFIHKYLGERLGVLWRRSIAFLSTWIFFTRIHPR